MTEIILGLIIIALLVKGYFDEINNKKERKELVKAVMAKNLQEFDSSTIIEKQEPKEDKLPDEIPFDEISYPQFEKALDIDGSEQT